MIKKHGIKSKILVFTAIVALLVPSVILAAKSASPKREFVTYYENIKVCDGDTLWGFAKKYKAEHESTKGYIRDLMEINGLKSDLIHAGSYIIVPIQYEIQP